MVNISGTTRSYLISFCTGLFGTIMCTLTKYGIITSSFEKLSAYPILRTKSEEYFGARDCFNYEPRKTAQNVIQKTRLVYLSIRCMSR